MVALGQAGESDVKQPSMGIRAVARIARVTRVHRLFLMKPLCISFGDDHGYETVEVDRLGSLST